MAFPLLSPSAAALFPLICLLACANGVTGQELGKWEQYAKDYAELTGRIPPQDAELVLAFVSKSHDRKSVRYVLSTGTSWNITTYVVALSKENGDGLQLDRLLLVSIEQQSREIREEQTHVLVKGVACEKPLPPAEVEKILLAGHPIMDQKKEFSPSHLDLVTAEELTEKEAPAGAYWRLTCEKKLIDRAKGIARLVIYLSDKNEVLDSSVSVSIE